MKKVMLLLCCLGITMSGCATVGKYEEKLDTYIGRDVSSLIEEMGVPNKSMDLPDGGKAYSFYHERASRSVSSSRFGNYSYGNITTHSCETTFFADKDNKIVKWLHSGNACRSS